jgi:hypothetical protein
MAMASGALICSGALSGEMYRWVDQNGVVHYSDRPQPGAEQITAPKISTYVPAASPAGVPAVATASAPVSVALRCAMAAPANDQTLINVNSVEFSFSGPKGTTARLFVDGKQVAEGGGTSLSVAPIFRGTHSASVRFVDAGGKVLCVTPQVVFHVRQASLLTPQRARAQPPATRAR